MLRKPGICQKPVITLYEMPAYAACGMAVGAEPTGVQPGAGTRKMAVLQMKFSLDGNTRFWKKITLFIKSGRIMDMRDGLRQKSMCPWKV